MRSKIVCTLNSWVPAPVIMMMSSGPSWSQSANFSDALRKSARASWPFSKVEWRRRTGYDAPGVKKSHSGNWGLETIVAIPRAPTPTGWVGLVPSFRAPIPKRSLSLFIWWANWISLNCPGGGGGCEKREKNNCTVETRELRQSPWRTQGRLKVLTLDQRLEGFKKMLSHRKTVQWAGMLCWAMDIQMLYKPCFPFPFSLWTLPLPWSLCIHHMRCYSL